MKKSLLYTLLLLLFLTLAQIVSAQTLGLTSSGTTGYPQTNIGNQLTEAGSNAGNFLIFNPVTTSVPLTAISIRTYGSVSGTISVTIYNDNVNTPGTKLFTEVAAGVTAGTLSNITITNIYLPAGKYWLAYDMNSSSATANFITKSSGVTGFVRKSMILTYGTPFPNNPTVGNLASGLQDHISFVGVAIEGYAKATKATLATPGLFSSMSFYSHATGNANLAIYTDASGVPSTKQWESGDFAVTVGAFTTRNISTGTPASLTLNPGTYWLVWQWNNANSGPSYTAGGAGTGNYLTQAYGGFPSSWTGGTASTENWSIYATYCILPSAAGTISGTATVCQGQNNVSYSVPAITNATSYTWSYSGAGTTISGSTNPMTINFAANATGGILTVMGSNACGNGSVSANYSITVNQLPVFTAVSDANVSCYAGSDGRIHVTISSTNYSPYSFSINNGTDNYTHANTGSYPNFILTGLSAGINYKIKIKDTNGCVSPDCP